MLNVRCEDRGGVALIRLVGSIDENFDLERELGGPLPQNCEINCRDVSQVNSLGMKAWVNFFSRAAARGVQFAFTECSPAIVEQLNYITNFACGGRVLSVSLPFNCASCPRELNGVVRSEELRRASFRVPPIRCPRCGRAAHFDESPEEYFAFLIRTDWAAAAA
jgi:anti-anti-sigma regulatory factor